MAIQLYWPGVVSIHAMPGNTRSGFFDLCSIQLSYGAIYSRFKWHRRDSNPQPKVPKYPDLSTPVIAWLSGGTTVRGGSLFTEVAANRTTHLFDQPKAIDTFYSDLNCQSHLFPERIIFIEFMILRILGRLAATTHRAGWENAVRYDSWRNMVSISPDLDRSIAGSVFTDRNPAYSLPTRLIQLPWWHFLIHWKSFGNRKGVSISISMPSRRHEINNAIASEKSIFIFNFFDRCWNVRSEPD